MNLTKPAKTHYSETEAAEALGVTVEELRSLIRHHIVSEEEENSQVSLANFQPSDLLLLKILSGLATSTGRR